MHALRRTEKLLLALFGLLWPGDLISQVPDTILGDTILAHAVLVAPFRDTMQVALREHGQYRLAVWPAGTQIEIVPVGTRGGAAYAPRMREGTGPLPTLIEVYPRTTAPHAFRLSPPRGADTVRIWLWADTTAEVRFREQRERQWGIGLEVAAGFHTGYQIQKTEPASEASADVEAGLLFGSSGRFALLLGVWHDGRYSGAPAITAMFAEPRLTLLRGRPGAPHALSLAVTGRLAQGNASGVTIDPSFYSVGALLNYHLDQRPGARGWRLGLQLAQTWVSNVPYDGDTHSTRLSIGVSWLP